MLLKTCLQRGFEFLKVGLSPFIKFVFIYFNENPSKMMKNAFYFMLKALFFLEIFTSLSWLFGYLEKRLDKKAMIQYVYTSWTSMFNEATFQEILLPSSSAPLWEKYSISRNVASLNILVHDVKNVLYYEHWTETERKYFYA